MKIILNLGLKMIIFQIRLSVIKKAKIFEEYVLEAAVAVEVKEKEADESELDEGTKSMNND